MGIRSPRNSPSSRSAKNTVAICRSVAPTAPPEMAETAASVGRSALEKVFICSMTAVPAPIRLSRLPAVRAVTASPPAIGRNRLSSPTPF